MLADIDCTHGIDRHKHIIHTMSTPIICDNNILHQDGRLGIIIINDPSEVNLRND